MNIPRLTTHLILGLAAICLLLQGCSGEGIDRRTGRTSAATGNTSVLANDGQSLPGFGNNAIDTSGPSRYVQLEKLSFEANLPSIVSVLFQAKDRYGNALAGLKTADFTLREDDKTISNTETSLSIVPHEELSFVLRTVIMIDVSSSILPSDLNKIKTAVRALLVDDNGNSRLMPQQEIALYSFNDNITRLKDFSTNAQGIVAALDSITPAIALTPTDFYGAIIVGASQWENSFDISRVTQGSLIVITDGTDTAGKHSYAEAAAAAIGKSVYTVGVGNEISSDVLSSTGSAGTFSLSNFDELNSTLQTINQKVKDTANSFYYLHYASPKRRAEGDSASSDHTIALSVVNNANSGATSVIRDQFDSSEFSNVSAQVVISGPAQIELQQTASYRANTRWGPAPDSSYQWSISEDTAACALEMQSDTVIRITGVATGNCTIAAEDTAAGNAKSRFSIEVVSD